MKLNHLWLLIDTTYYHHILYQSLSVARASSTWAKVQKHLVCIDWLVRFPFTIIMFLFISTWFRAVIDHFWLQIYFCSCFYFIFIFPSLPSSTRVGMDLLHPSIKSCQCSPAADCAWWIQHNSVIVFPHLHILLPTRVLTPLYSLSISHLISPHWHHAPIMMKPFIIPNHLRIPLLHSLEHFSLCSPLVLPWCQWLPQSFPYPIWEFRSSISSSDSICLMHRTHAFHSILVFRPQLYPTIEQVMIRIYSYVIPSSLSLHGMSWARPTLFPT